MREWISSFFLILSVFAGSLQAVHFEIQDLETLSNRRSDVSGLSASEHVTGYFISEEEIRYVFMDYFKKVDFIWNAKEGLIPLSHQPTYQAPFINNHNTVAGLYLCHISDHWFSPVKGYKHLYLQYADGSFQDIGVPKNWQFQEMYAYYPHSWMLVKDLLILGFNDKEQILISNNKQGNALRLAIWENGTFIELAPEALKAAYGLNNEGIILGCQDFMENGEKVSKVVLYDWKNHTYQKVMTSENLLKAKFNDRGQVIAVVLEAKRLVGLFWDPEEGITQLDYLPLALNNLGDIVGLKEDNTHCFFGNDGEEVDLRVTLHIGEEGSPWKKLGFISAMNDDRAIIGTGVTKDEKHHAYFITPIDRLPDETELQQYLFK